MNTPLATKRTSVQVIAALGVGVALLAGYLNNAPTLDDASSINSSASFTLSEAEVSTQASQEAVPQPNREASLELPSQVREETEQEDRIGDATPTFESSSSSTAVVNDSSGRLQVSNLVDAPLGAMSPSVENLVNPPNGTDAFVVEGDGYGTPGNTEGLTTVVAMHSGSLRSEAVGNALFDRDARSPLVAVGDSVSIDGRELLVSRVEIVDKPRLATSEWIWENSSGRVVLITCLQRPTGEGRSTQNLVIEASPVDL